MAGTIIGGKKAAAKNIANNPNHYKNIGAIGGKNGHEGGFYATAQMECDCGKDPQHRNKAACAGAKGGFISRRKKISA